MSPLTAAAPYISGDVYIYIYIYIPLETSDMLRFLYIYTYTVCVHMYAFMCLYYTSACHLINGRLWTLLVAFAFQVLFDIYLLT